MVSFAGEELHNSLLLVFLISSKRGIYNLYYLLNLGRPRVIKDEEEGTHPVSYANIGPNCSVPERNNNDVYYQIL